MYACLCLNDSQQRLVHFNFLVACWHLLWLQIQTILNEIHFGWNKFKVKKEYQDLNTSPSYFRADTPPPPPPTPHQTPEKFKTAKVGDGMFLLDMGEPSRIFLFNWGSGKVVPRLFMMWAVHPLAAIRSNKVLSTLNHYLHNEIIFSRKVLSQDISTFPQ